MGGIIGKLTFDCSLRVSPATAARMLDASRHRGGGASGLYTAPGIALGWCGAEAGAAPEVAGNECGTVRAVADSDLANAGSVRRQLERLGHRIQRGTDAELVAHAYEQWGDACVERLSGPFACAVWDEPRRRLLLARDHVGLRPLCFALLHGDGVVFASETSALLQDSAVSREWHPDAIDAYLALGYVPSPLTMYRRISKLEPAHTLLVEGRRLSTRQYWDFPSIEPSAGSVEETVDTLAARLRACVASHLHDGGAAALHSGGTASSAIVAALPRGAAAVAVGIEQDPGDLQRIARTGEHFGLHSEIDLALPDAVQLAPTLAARFDEPMADPAAVTQYAVFAAARRYAAVAVTGHGAGALWAGYARHRVEQVEADVRSLLVGPLARIGARVGRTLGAGVRGASMLARLALPPDGACARKHAYGYFDDERRHELYTRTFAWDVRHTDPFARHRDLYLRCPSPDALHRALYVDLRTELPDCRLAIADRTSGAASLRLRHPFLDRDLIRIAAAAPSGLKLHGASGMYALRRALARRLPPGLMPPARRRAPRRPWLADALARLVPDVLLGPRFDNRGIVSRPVLLTLWGEHRRGRRDHAHRLWALLMLEFWCREYVDGDAAAHPAGDALLLRAA